MRDKNIAIFEETVSICRRGSYTLDDKTVSLKLSQEDMAQVIALAPDMSQKIMDNAGNLGTDRAFVVGRTGVYVENRDSFEVARNIIPGYDRGKEDSRSILVLNFANPVHPGGGVTRGARAQEEDLCRKSTLYVSLLSEEAGKMYEYNREAKDYLATDYMLLSPNVEIFRDSDGGLSEETYVVGVLTAAAPMVNRGKITATEEEITEIIRRRIRKMLYVAAHFGYQYLVLGAWGCGAFGNDADTVARLFYEELRAYKEKVYNRENTYHTLKDCFRRIAFGVLDRTKDQYNFKAFQKYFSDFYAEDEKTEQERGEATKRETEKHLDVIRGSLFGGAMGDALGYPVEFLQREKILQQFGNNGISGYVLNDKGLAEISDDTQMTLFTATGILLGITRGKLRGIMGPLESYIWKSYTNWCEMQMGLNPEGVQRFSWLLDVPEMGENRAPGTTCVHAIMKQRSGSVENPLNDSKGCGGIMRIAPIALYFNRTGDNNGMQKVFIAASEVAALTHGHELGWLSSGMAACIINQVAYKKVTVEEAARSAIRFVKEYYSDRKHSKELISIVERALLLAKTAADDMENIRSLGEGWVAEETLAIAIYCSVKYQDDFSKALCAAVNHDGDSDSTGAVTGNILGAYLGYEKIPKRWKENLECADIIDEAAVDLCHGCIMSEYSTYKDSEWEMKYIRCKLEADRGYRKNFKPEV